MQNWLKRRISGNRELVEKRIGRIDRIIVLDIGNRENQELGKEKYIKVYLSKLEHIRLRILQHIGTFQLEYRILQLHRPIL